MPKPIDDREAWLRVLDQLEADVNAVAKNDQGEWDSERLRRLAAWKAPRRLGPIPHDQVDRALKLLAVQHDVIRRLESMQKTTAKHLRAVRAVPDGHSGETAVYLDVKG